MNRHDYIRAEPVRRTDRPLNKRRSLTRAKQRAARPALIARVLRLNPGSTYINDKLQKPFTYQYVLDSSSRRHYCRIHLDGHVEIIGLTRPRVAARI